jgi:hypothetical protein
MTAAIPAGGARHDENIGRSAMAATSVAVQLRAFRSQKLERGRKMKRTQFSRRWAALALFVLIPEAWSQSTNSRSIRDNVSTKTQDDPHSAPSQAKLAFVTEYVRELAAIEALRASSEQSLTEGSS